MKRKEKKKKIPLISSIEVSFKNTNELYLFSNHVVYPAMHFNRRWALKATVIGAYFHRPRDLPSHCIPSGHRSISFTATLWNHYMINFFFINQNISGSTYSSSPQIFATICRRLRQLQNWLDASFIWMFWDSFLSSFFYQWSIIIIKIWNSHTV